jgi:hypothetical protein
MRRLSEVFITANIGGREDKPVLIFSRKELKQGKN